MADWHEKYFEMLYLYVRRQNERLLYEIAIREDIPYRKLQKMLPSQAALRTFLRNRQSDTTHPGPVSAHSRVDAGILGSDNPQ